MSAAAAPLPAELFAQIRAIQIRAQRLVTDALAGDYKSAFRGRGIEFEQVREYQPGDDVRRIDWNVTAKSSAPFVKEHREERELTVMLLVDVSASGAFGSTTKLKREVAAEVAAVLAASAMRSNDKVGLLVFSDRVEHFIPPKKGRSHLWRVIREILSYEPQGRGTNIATALTTLGHVLHRRAVCFVLSDFIDDGFDMALRLLARRHDVTAVTLTDPREQEVPPVGLLQLEDLESGELLLLDTFSARARAQIAELARGRQASLSDRLRQAGVGEIAIRTGESYVEPIVRYFRRRER